MSICESCDVLFATTPYLLFEKGFPSFENTDFSIEFVSYRARKGFVWLFDNFPKYQNALEKERRLESCGPKKYNAFVCEDHGICSLYNRFLTSKNGYNVFLVTKHGYNEFFWSKNGYNVFLAKMDIFDQKKTLKPGFLTKNRYSQTIIIVFFF